MSGLGALSMWTVYRRPRDYPDRWVARRFEIGARSDPLPTNDMFVANSLPELRALLPSGLACIPRSPGDDFVVVESWI